MKEQDEARPSMDEVPRLRGVIEHALHELRNALVPLTLRAEVPDGVRRALAEADLMQAALRDGAPTPVPAEAGAERINRAVVVTTDDARSSCLLYWVGPALFAFVRRDKADVYDLGLSGGPAGVSVWEGRYEWVAEDEFQPAGAFRRPTDGEWAAIRDGRHPWPDEVRCLGCDAPRQDPPAQHDLGCSVVGEPPGL